MPVVKYSFVQEGADAVESAFRRIGDERRKSREVGGGAGRSTNPEASKTREAEREAKRRERIAEKEAQSKVRSEERAQKEATRVAQRESKARAQTEERERKQTARTEERDRRERERAAEKEARARSRTAEKEARSREKVARKEESEKRREAEKTDRLYSSFLKRTPSNMSTLRSGFDKWQRETPKRRTLFMRGGELLTGLAAGGMASAGSAITGLVGRGLSGTMSLAEMALKDKVDLNDTARRVAINSRASGDEFANVTRVRDQFTQIGKDAKVKPIDVATGVQAFITKTGDSKKAMEFAPIVATAAKAADANLESVSKTAADLFQKFGIQTAEEMQKALAAIYFGGKAGAFELSDFAEKMAPIASAGQRFGVDKGVSGVKTMQGLAQIAMSSVGDRDRAATAVEATLRQLVAQSGKLEGMGVKVFDRKTNKTRNVTDVLTETISAVGGLDAQRKTAGLQKIFGDEGIRGISPLIDAYMTAARGTTGSTTDKRKAGEAAVRGELDKAINAAGTWGEVVKDAAFAQQSSSSQLSSAWDELKGKVGDALLPAFNELAPKLPELASAVIPVVEAMADLAAIALEVIRTLKSVGVLSESDKPKTAQEREAFELKFLKDIGVSEENAPSYVKMRLASARREMADANKESQPFATQIEKQIYGGVDATGARGKEILAQLTQGKLMDSLPTTVQSAIETGAKGQQAPALSELDRAAARLVIQFNSLGRSVGTAGQTSVDSIYAGG